MTIEVSWWRRHDTLLIAAGAIILLAMLAGYNVYAARVTHRNDVTATKVQRLSVAACGSTQFLYDFLNALALDSSPRFGSPAEGPIVPGARAKLIGRLFANERISAAPLRVQGCRLRVPK